jgi:hypothetical protein
VGKVGKLLKVFKINSLVIKVSQQILVDLADSRFNTTLTHFKPVNRATEDYY